MAIKDDHETPLIPDIEGITADVRSRLLKCEELAPSFAALEQHFVTDCREAPSMEDMLTHIRALRAVSGNDKVRGLSAKDLDGLDVKICDIVHEVVNRTLPPGGATPYHRVASWADAVRRGNPVEIFTPNYDLLMEEALEDCRVPYFDGFAGIRKPFFDLRAMEEDMLPPRWARLWKLHGSINWYEVDKTGVFRGASVNQVGAKRVIHPSHQKYQESRRLPYLAMMDRLRAFFGQPSPALVLCGYSFRDEHINEVIVQGLQSNENAIAFALLFGRLADYPAASNLAVGRSNLSLLARDSGIVHGDNSKWSGRFDDPIMAYCRRVEGEAVDDAVEGEAEHVELLLGDFLIFGKLLHEVAGDVRRRRDHA